MPFRDDREAAHARADALERELRAKERELQETRTELARARGEPVEDESQIGARRAVSLRAIEAARVEATQRLTAANGGPAETRRVQRLLQSVQPEGDGVVLAWVIALVLAVASVAGFVETGWLLGSAAAAGAVAFAYGSLRLDGRRRARKVTEEFEWAAARPYALEGYPALLDAPPRSSYSGVSGGHERIIVRLEFAEDEPVDLSPRVAAFDDGLTRDTEGAFAARSPVTRLGESDQNADHNLAVSDWLRRLDHELLEPLVREHRLARVAVDLE